MKFKKNVENLLIRFEFEWFSRHKTHQKKMNADEILQSEDVHCRVKNSQKSIQNDHGGEKESIEREVIGFDVVVILGDRVDHIDYQADNRYEVAGVCHDRV